MKAKHYAARAGMEIANLASHHDTPKDEVAGLLKMLAQQIEALTAGLDAARDEYAAMRVAEAKAAEARKIERLVRGGK
jgi:hypothetical protein